MTARTAADATGSVGPQTTGDVRRQKGLLGQALAQTAPTAQHGSAETGGPALPSTGHEGHRRYTALLRVLPDADVFLEPHERRVLLLCRLIAVAGEDPAIAEVWDLTVRQSSEITFMGSLAAILCGRSGAPICMPICGSIISGLAFKLREVAHL